jgi:hypothetical protein
VAALLYQVYKLLKGSVAIKIFLGFLSLYLIYLLVRAVRMELLSIILGQFMGVGVIAAIIIFAPEIRKFLLILGRSSIFSDDNVWKDILFFWKKKENSGYNISPIIDAAKVLAGSNTGALIVISSTVELKFYAESGDILDAELSKRLLISIFNKDQSEVIKKSTAIRHSFTNGSVLLILGSLVIGYLATAQQAEGIKPFTNDLFKGFLAIFLLDMGITSGRKLKAFFSFGWFPTLFAILIPLVNGCAIAWISLIVTDDITNRFMFAILAASASYIAVPAAMKISVPKANPGLFLPMALAVTFPVNITIGMPIYFLIVQNT